MKCREDTACFRSTTSTVGVTPFWPVPASTGQFASVSSAPCLAGRKTEGSDVDLLVRYAPDRSLIDHIAFSQSLHRLLKVPVDVISESGLSPFLRERVLQDAVDL